MREKLCLQHKYLFKVNKSDARTTSAEQHQATLEQHQHHCSAVLTANLEQVFCHCYKTFGVSRNFHVFRVNNKDFVDLDHVFYVVN